MGNMKKGLIFLLILLLLFTFCNLVSLNKVNKIYREVELEYQAVCAKEAELIRTIYYQMKSENIFDYIQARNKKITVPEIAGLVSYAFELAEETETDGYGILAICDIEADFDVYAKGEHTEQGPMQLTRKNWDANYRKFGFKPEDFDNWRCTMKVAAYHFKWLMQKNNNDVIAAIGEYNGGGNWQNIESSLNHVRKYLAADRAISKYRDRN